MANETDLFVKEERNLYRCDVKFNNETKKWNVIQLRIIKKEKTD
jgi:hypothetical protein|tara:strand:- start:45 stop:176 length:132 start_codon:yes stop_codon:yes gene_type:complete